MLSLNGIKTMSYVPEALMRILQSLHAAVMLVAMLGSGTALAQTSAGPERLFFEGDIVRGRSQQGATGPTCVLASQFKRRELVAWRIRVLDPEGKAVDDKGLKSLQVELPDGQKFAAKFGNHPARGTPTDRFWATSWMIPEEYPTGTFSYKIVATDLAGKTHTWEPFKVASSQLTIIPGTVEFTK
jgi:hypothetical protein